MTENIKNNFNREILINLLMTNMKKLMVGKPMFSNSKLMLTSKVIMTDIISSFKVNVYVY